MAVIEAAELRRTYRTTTGILRRRALAVEAVRGVTFEVAEGELFGLLGPNGAGKTTTIKMLITLLIPTSGSARVLGHDVVDDAREVRRRVGYVLGGDRGLYERLSGLDNLRYFAELYGVPARDQRARIGELRGRAAGEGGRRRSGLRGHRHADAGLLRVGEPAAGHARDVLAGASWFDRRRSRVARLSPCLRRAALALVHRCHPGDRDGVTLLDQTGVEGLRWRHQVGPRVRVADPVQHRGDREIGGGAVGEVVPPHG